ncbi:hypothetical protein [Bergeyella sp. RCAD1439]|uniref:hypothetical protein n=1 Tax=Bergeyella anatis TaxID=3113737 RepID=UPI002E19396E|nr:hypothetical protein [Bergeyella sp. RCAD1439]
MFKLYQKFFQYNRKEPLEPNLYVLYITLLEIWIENNTNPFEASTHDLLPRVNMSRATINRTKFLLKQKGLIEYSSQKGGANKFTLVEINEEVEIPQIEPEKLQMPQMEVPKIEQPLENAQKATVVIPELPKEETPKSKIISNAKDIPPFSEVLNFAKTIKIYNDSMEIYLQSKYDSWVENGWRNGFDKPITNWKSSIRNTIPHLNKTKNTTSISIPTIKRPITTYDE